MRVDWSPTAQRRLASVWVAATSAERREITKAAHEIDRVLGSDPLQAGESRPKGRRVLFVAPLGVTFRVLPQRSLVRVLLVWRY